MNVRNEAHIIERCLVSALPLVDGWVICDTGSTDATREIVAAVTERLGKPGRLTRHAWRNFGYNRTLSAQEARAWVDERAWPRQRTYLLFLDADMVLEATPDFDAQTLDATYYQVVQENEALSYANTRLACLSHDWYAVGATHEYWQAAGEARGERLETLLICDLGDGGSKGGKLIRDYRLLRHELARDSGNSRHTFYLAQTCFDGGRFAEAVRWYSRRWAMGGWDEERWYARYKQGLALLHLKDVERAAGVLLSAFDERPSRAEPLWALARFYREQGRYQNALMLAERALQIAFPAQDLLFIEKPIYEWRLWEEIMLSAWYVEGQRELGFAACERLRLGRGHDEAFYNYVACNETYYLSPLPRRRSGGVECDRVSQQVAELAMDGAQAMQAKIELTLAMTVRINSAAPWHGAGENLTLEDVAWTEHAGRLWLTATSCQVPETNRRRPLLARISSALDAVEQLVPLGGAIESVAQLLPWSRDDQLCVIAGYDPLEVLSVDDCTGATALVHVTLPPFRALGLRGVAPPVPIPGRNGRFLLLSREVVVREQGNAYMHRFIELDEREGIISASRPFVFDQLGVEQVGGLCDLGDGRLLATYGDEAGQAHWLELEWCTLLDALITYPIDTR